MDLIELSNKYKNKILNIAIIILALIISSNIYKKQAKEIESLKGKTNVEIKKNNMLKNISQLEKRINTYRNLFAKKDVSLVINTISNIAKESGIKIVSIKPIPEQRQIYPEYIKFPFNLVLTASKYHALGKFISKVEGYRDVYVVDSLEMRFEPTKEELTVNLKVSSIAFTD